jgi:hypothetical protein
MLGTRREVRRAAFATLALLIAACTDESKRAWQSDTDYSYSVNLHSRVGTRATPAPLFDLRVTGMLHVRPSKLDEGQRILELRLENAQVASLAGSEHDPQLAQYSADLAHPVQAETKDGVVTALRIAPQSSPMAVALLRTLASALQLPAGPKGKSTFEVREYDSTGRYLARYENGRDGQTQKTKIRYESLLSVHGNEAKTGMGDVPVLPEIKASKIQLKVTDEVPARVQVSEWVVTPMMASSELDSRTDLTLELRAQTPFEGGIEASSELVRLPADKPFAAKPKLEDLDAKRIGDLTFEQVVTGLEEIARDYDPTKLGQQDSEASLSDEQKRMAAAATERNRYFTALAALYRSKPELVEQTLAKIRAKSTASQWLVNGLGASGSPVAQEALAEVIRDASLEKTLRKSAVVSLLQANQPTISSARVAESLLDDPEWTKVATYGVGTYARRMREAGELQESQRLVAVLLKRLSGAQTEAQIVDLLSGLSNAADNSVLARVRPYLTRDVEDIREAAVLSLRLMDTPEADDLLAERVVKDTAPKVRTAAAKAAGKREAPRQSLLKGVSDAASQDQDARVRIAALRTLGAWMPKHPELRSAVQAVADRDTDPNVSVVAKAVLSAAGS